MRRHRLTNTLALLALASALAAPFQAQKKKQDAAATTAAPIAVTPRYAVGEKLTYTVSFSNFADAANVELYVAGRGSYFGREGVELRAHVATVGQVRAALLAVNNYYFAYADPATGLPYRSQTVAASPSPPMPSNTLLGVARTEDVTTVAPPASAELVSSVHDFVSAIYYARALPLAEGATYPLAAQLSGARYDAELRVTGRETVKTPAGSFNAIATQIRVRQNPSADDYRVRLYFSDDERHVPVLLVARHPAGEIRAALASDATVVPQAGQLASQPTNAQPAPTRVPADPARPSSPRPTPTPTRGASGSASAASNDLPFDVGEQLNFNFFLGNAAQPVGAASFIVRARGRYFNREGMVISATLATNDLAARLFPVRDTVVTYVATTTLLPFRNELQIQEGSHHVQGVVSLDQERGTAVVTDGKTIEIPVGTYDFVSVLYALRSFDLTPPKRNAVSLLINARPRTLSITSVSRDVIELGGQRISAYQLALATDDAQGNRFNLRLWVGADKRRLPLRLTATTPLGPLRADLSIIPLTRQ